MSELKHIPVLINEAVQGLAIRENGIYVDATVGFGGYTELIADQLGSGRVIGIDADKQALYLVEDRLSSQISEGKVILKHSNFRFIEQVLAELRISSLDGIVADLGLSSMELDDVSRGFSFKDEAPLDMRFDTSSDGLTAEEIVNTYSQDELTQLFRDLGDEPFAGRIARVIVENRKKKSIKTTTQLVDIILSIVPTKFSKKSIHPATRVFQALRMEVNDEIGALNSLLASSLNLLNSSGRLAIVSFHSGEDRIVKNTFREWKSEGFVNILTKKPIGPSDLELGANPRSRSAKLRIIEKI
ncbi:MAG: S-adenosyl-methyltransferase MraW [Candidatus Parcubacteria bacterium]|jgi:16S rRNA (cytosine1402-N4)-methyltransferase